MLVYGVFHANNTFAQIGRMLFINETHYLVSFLAGLYWSVVITAFAEPQQFQLIIKTEFALWGYQSSVGIGIPNAFDARFAKSSFISSLPILL